MSTIYKEHIVSNRKRAYAMATFVSELVRSDTFPGIIFVKELAHANFLSSILTEVLGVKVPAVSAQVSQKLRDSYLARMRERDASLPVCVATTVWSTGVDVPALRWGLVAGCGKAPIGLRQQAGRLTRTCEDKAEYKLYHWIDTGEGMETYERQGHTALQHYARSGFNIAGLTCSPQDVKPVDTPTGLLEHMLDSPRPSVRHNREIEVLTPGQQLADAMCQSPQGFILLMVFYALCGVSGLIVLLALLRLLLLGPA